MVIRSPESDDEVVSIYHLIRTILPDNNETRDANFYLQEFHKNPQLILVNEENNEFIGACFGFIEGDHVLLGELVVDRKHQRQGLGSKLLGQFEKNTKNLKQTKILLGSYGTAEGFYLKKGYIPKLFIQIEGPEKEEKLKSFLSFLPNSYPVTWKENSEYSSKAIIATGKLDKDLQEKAKAIKGCHAQYIFLKDL